MYDTALEAFVRLLDSWRVIYSIDHEADGIYVRIDPDAEDSRIGTYGDISFVFTEEGGFKEITSFE